MNCIIPGQNLKVMAKALLSLAKIGDEVYLEADKDKITLITLNLRKTICIRYNLLDSFFSSYDVDENVFNEQHKAIACKINLKILLPLFKGVNLEKKLDFIKLEHENNGDNIYVKMKFKCDDIIMVHKLRLMDTESLTIEIKSDTGSNNILATSSFFNQLLTMFSNTDDEITLEITKYKVTVRNYIVGAPVSSKYVRSQMNLNASEFSKFEINNETSLNFSLKPLRTAVQFAEVFNLNIGINFEVGGKPLTLVMKNPTFEVNFMVATLNPYSDLQSSMATTSIPAKITQLNNENANLTIEDQQALLSENWDIDMECDAEVNRKIEKKRPCETEKKDRDKSSCKKFKLPPDSSPMDVDRTDADIVPASPESPKTKRTKLVFGRCFEPTFCESNLGDILAPNSDSE